MLSTSVLKRSKPAFDMSVHAHHAGRIGGRLQRREREREQERSRSPRRVASSRLASRLLLNWAWKQSSAREVQELAAAAESDFGTQNTVLHKLASIGSGGRNPQNAQRDLVRSFANAPVKQYVSPLNNPGSDVACMVCPHELFHMLYTCHPVEFQEHLGARRAWLAEFWENFSGTPEGRELMRYHPDLQGRPRAFTM